MSHMTVPACEKLFNDAVVALRETRKDGISNLIVQSQGLNQLGNATDRDFGALGLLQKYVSKPSCDQAAMAGGLQMVVAKFSASNREYLLQQIKADTNLLLIYMTILLPKLKENIRSDFDLTNASKDEAKAAAEVMKKDVLNSPKERMGQVLAVLVDNFIGQLTLAESKSSFAALCFVLIKKLDIPVKKETLDKVICGCDFSKGIVHIGTNKNRRSQEFAAVSDFIARVTPKVDSAAKMEMKK